MKHWFCRLYLHRINWIATWSLTEFLASDETLKNEPNLENNYINNLELILNTTLENQFISFSGNLYDISIFLQNVQDTMYKYILLYGAVRIVRDAQ